MFIKNVAPSPSFLTYLTYSKKNGSATIFKVCRCNGNHIFVPKSRLRRCMRTVVSRFGTYIKFLFIE